MTSRRVIPLSEIMRYVDKLGSGDGVCRKAPNRTNQERGGANAQRWWIEDEDIALTGMSCEK